MSTLTYKIPQEGTVSRVKQGFFEKVLNKGGTIGQQTTAFWD